MASRRPRRDKRGEKTGGGRATRPPRGVPPWGATAKFRRVAVVGCVSMSRGVVAWLWVDSLVDPVSDRVHSRGTQLSEPPEESSLLLFRPRGPRRGTLLRHASARAFQVPTPVAARARQLRCQVCGAGVPCRQPVLVLNRAGQRQLITHLPGNISRFVGFCVRTVSRSSRPWSP